MVRHGLDGGVHGLGALGEGDAGIDELAVVGGELGLQGFGGAGLAGPEQEVGAGAVIILAERLAVAGEDDALQVVFQGVVAPDILDDGVGARAVAHLAQGVGERDLAGAGLRAGLVQPFHARTGIKRRQFDDLFGALAHLGGLRPAVQHGEGEVQLVERHARHAFAGALPHDEILQDRVGRRVLQGGEFGPLAAFSGAEGAGEVEHAAGFLAENGERRGRRRRQDRGRNGGGRVNGQHGFRCLNGEVFPRFQARRLGRGRDGCAGQERRHRHKNYEIPGKCHNGLCLFLYQSVTIQAVQPSTHFPRFPETNP